MKYKDVEDHFESIAAAARAIGRNRQTVHAWKKSGRVPLEEQMEYEIATGGILRADVPDQIRRAGRSRQAA